MTGHVWSAALLALLVVSSTALAQQTPQPSAADRARVEQAIRDATEAAKEKLEIEWLTALDAATAKKLAAWGKGDSGARRLYLNGVQALDAATAERLTDWGRGESGWRALFLEGVQALDASAERTLRAWDAHAKHGLFCRALDR